MEHEHCQHQVHLQGVLPKVLTCHSVMTPLQLDSLIIRQETVEQLLELQAVQSVSTNTTPTIIQQVIDRYQHLFLKLHGLPPQCERLIMQFLYYLDGAQQFGLQTILVLQCYTRRSCQTFGTSFRVVDESTTAVSETVQVRRLDGINTVATGKLALSKLMVYSLASFTDKASSGE